MCLVPSWLYKPLCPDFLQGSPGTTVYIKGVSLFAFGSVRFQGVFYGQLTAVRSKLGGIKCEEDNRHGHTNQVERAPLLSTNGVMGFTPRGVDIQRVHGYQDKAYFCRP